jgi:ATP synthase F0 subunit c
MRSAHLLLAALLLLLVTASAVMAQPTKSGDKLSDEAMKQQKELAEAGRSPNFGPGFGAGVGMGLAIVGIGIGIGLVGHSALAGIARQPEQAGAIQGAMFILAGLVEGAGIIALVLCLALVFL